MCVTGEENDPTAVRRKASEQAKNQDGVRNMIDLKSLIKPVAGCLCRGYQVPVERIANNALNLRQLTSSNLAGKRLGKGLNGSEVR